MYRQLFDDAGRQLFRDRKIEDEYSNACIADSRVARLLIVLNELDECVAGLQDVPKPELVELVSSAIQACGFTDPNEARYAITAVLQAIESPYLPVRV
jgi:hypothetical protein